MKENARLIGLGVFFVVLAAITWKWQQSTATPSSGDPAPQQSAGGSPSDEAIDTPEIPNSTTAEENVAVAEDAPKRVVSKKAASARRTVLFSSGKGKIYGSLDMNDNKPYPEDLKVALHFITEKSKNNFTLDTSVLESSVDDQGRYEFEKLPMGSYNLFVESKGYTGNATTSLTHQRKSVMRNIVVYAGSTIQGTVFDREGNPIEEASVFAVSWQQNGGEQHMQLNRSRASQNITDESGRFVIRNTQVRTPEISYKLMATAPGLANAFTSFVNPGDTEIEITLLPGQDISGTVIDANTRAPMQNIKVLPHNPDVLNRPMDSTNADGEFILTNVSPGTMRLTIEHESYILKNKPPRVAVQLDVQTPPVTIEVVAGGTIVGRALDIDTKDGIAHAKIHLMGTIDRRYQVEKTATSDANGDFQFSGLPTGSYGIRHEVLRGFGLATPIENRIEESDHTQLVSVALADVASDITCYYRKGIRIAGRVVDKNNDPIADVSVSGYADVEDSNGMRTSSRDTTDQNGRFLLAGFSPNETVSVRGYKDSYSRKKQPPVKLSSSDVTGVTIVLTKGASIDGTVLDRNGNPLTVGTLELRQGKDPVDRKNINQDGTFDFPDVEAGTYTIIYSANRSSNEKNKKLDTVSVLAGQQLGGLRYQVNIDSSRAISGTVANVRGEPIVATLQAVDENGHRVNTTADEDGKYDLVGLLEGTYNLTASSSNYNLQVRKDIGTPAIGINFVLTGRASVSGTVVDAATGNTIPSFEIAVSNSSRTYKYGSRNGSFRSFTGTDGSFTYNNIAINQSERKLIVKARNYSSTEYELGQLYPDQEMANVQMVLTVGATVEGIVTDSTGKPVHAAKVGPSSDAFNRPNDSEFVSYTDREGKYTLSSVPTGEVTLLAHKANMDLEKRVVSISGPGQYRQDFQLFPGSTVEGFVTMDDAPAPNAVIHIDSINLGGSGNSKLARTDHEGFYRITNLPSGASQIRAEVPAIGGGDKKVNRNASSMLTVPKGQTLRHDVSFSVRSASLSGAILDEDGNPISGANLSVKNLTGAFSESFRPTSYEAGRYVFEHLPHGSFSATVYHNQKRFTVTFELSENENKKYDFKFKSGATLIGTNLAATEPGTEWGFFLFRNEVEFQEPLGIEFLMTVENESLGQSSGGSATQTMENVSAGTFKLMAFSLKDPNDDDIEELLSNLAYSIQTITIKENEVVELKFDF